jgi:hypothetical protein
MRRLGERVQLMAETTQCGPVGPQSDKRGTELKDRDETDGEEAASLNGGQQWRATGHDRRADADSKQTRYVRDCN